MCGRFTLTTPGEVLAEAFGLDTEPALAPRYNIAPTQPLAAVRQGPDGRRSLVLLRWGLLPSTTRETERPLINARAETVARLPSFRDAFRARRCLVPADGFYEWKAGGPRKQPVHIRFADRRPFAFAGLWEPRTRGPEGETSGSCALLTTEPNSLMREIHDRMPVILPPDHYAGWLDPASRPAELAALLRPHPADAMEARTVGTFVNNARNEGPECLAAAQPLV
jgi:putative SOS response-associated peptidase YedK